MLVGELSKDINDEIIFSEFDAETAYQKSLANVKDIYDGKALESIELMTPFLALSDQLSSCTPVQAQVIYSDISKGYSLISQIYGKAIFDRDNAKTELDNAQGACYLEEFPKYVAEMKSKGIIIKDTDASRTHYLNSHDRVINAKHKVDFYEAYSITVKGWQSKLYADMTNARNLVYAKRYNDDLSGKAN